MEFFRGSSAGASFEVEGARYTLTPDVVSRADVQASGLIQVIRKEGFKDIPPVVPRTQDGAYQINRPSLGFELLVEHLLGLEPLKNTSMAEFADKYIALKNELLFWQLPTIDVSFNDALYYQTAWTDGDCFFPLKSADADAFEREAADSPQAPNVVQLKKQSITPASLEGLADGEGWTTWSTSDDVAQQSQLVYITAGTKRFFCMVPGMKQPAVHNASLPELGGFKPFFIRGGLNEITLVWTEGVFVYIRGSTRKSDGSLRFQVQLIQREPAWLCIHPTLGVILSGVEGPVPLVFCFSMRGADVVRFFPWGALAINKEVVCNTIQRQTTGVVEQQQPRGILESLGVGHASGGDSSGMPVLAATLMRFQNKSFQPPIRISFVNVDKEEGSVTLRRGLDYDIHDLRNEQATDFNVMVAIGGGLAEASGEDAVADKVKGGKSIVFPITGNGTFAKEAEVLIENGGPGNEELTSIGLYGEYACNQKKYSTFKTGRRLFDFHRSMVMSRLPGQGAGCNVM